MNKSDRITSFVCFDIETTGLSPEEDYIIEIGAVKVREGKITEYFNELVKPPVALPEKIIELTGITEDMLKEAQNQDKVIPRFVEFAGDDILMGHNIMFDYSFLKVGTSRLGIPFEKQGIDTLKISKGTIPEEESKSLANLCSLYKVVNPSAHRAFHDAKATAVIYAYLCNDFFTEHGGLFMPADLNYKVKKSQPITDKQKNYLNHLLKYHKIEYVEQIEGLTRNEASRLIDKIILNKGRINEGF
ncbi:3'-5' exonuclease [Anaerocolumna xylanovorans]|uniref:DNA polymerase-3 subunit alpha n=1 Tax=Anaerocolumna xylanovorans DSM 12503 TaxID=1121345 RepID=A0A1M7Y6K8_9FIRM|nr:3'-5' exonuclease [Anaerocolumna xylanovorans]SHO48269.1 DNA polymerase-3 subunit alpha [Anaerocolumna xylanovorans DSM 12503]